MRGPDLRLMECRLKDTQKAPAPWVVLGHWVRATRHPKMAVEQGNVYLIGHPCSSPSLPSGSPRTGGSGVRSPQVHSASNRFRTSPEYLKPSSSVTDKCLERRLVADRIQV